MKLKETHRTFELPWSKEEQLYSELEQRSYYPAYPHQDGEIGEVWCPSVRHGTSVTVASIRRGIEGYEIKVDISMVEGRTLVGLLSGQLDRKDNSKGTPSVR